MFCQAQLRYCSAFLDGGICHDVDVVSTLEVHEVAGDARSADIGLCRL